jgi:hypothetical protein
MKDFPKVTKDDCLTLANFANALRLAKLPEAGLQQIMGFADGVRWLQELAQAMAMVYAKSQESPPEEEGFKVKALHPGGGAEP